jgi:carbonic anhydrase/acetyltransferase-like protein (isoleucine patch superfamily)
MQIKKTLRKPSYRVPRQPLILVGVRANIADTKTLAEKCGYRVIGILDQYYWGNRSDIDGIPIIGSEQWLLDSTNNRAQEWIRTASFFCSSWWTGKQHLNTLGLDDDIVRQQRINLLDQLGVKLATLIDPTSWIPGRSTVKIDPGVMICGSVMIGSNVVIGAHSVIDWGSAISRNTQIGQNCIVGVRAYVANYLVGNHVRIGVGAIAVGSKKDLTYATIGDHCIIQLGAVVADDVPERYVRTFTNRTIARIDNEKN